MPKFKFTPRQSTGDGQSPLRRSTRRKNREDTTGNNVNNVINDDDYSTDDGDLVSPPIKKQRSKKGQDGESANSIDEATGSQDVQEDGNDSMDIDNIESALKHDSVQSDNDGEPESASTSDNVEKANTPETQDGDSLIDKDIKSNQSPQENTASKSSMTPMDIWKS